MDVEDEAIEGNRNDRYRSVNALAFGDGPRKSYLVSVTFDYPFQRQRQLYSSHTESIHREICQTYL